MAPGAFSGDAAGLGGDHQHLLLVKAQSLHRLLQFFTQCAHLVAPILVTNDGDP